MKRRRPAAAHPTGVALHCIALHRCQPSSAAVAEEAVCPSVRLLLSVSSACLFTPLCVAVTEYHGVQRQRHHRDDRKGEQRRRGSADGGGRRGESNRIESRWLSTVRLLHRDAAHTTGAPSSALDARTATTTRHCNTALHHTTLHCNPSLSPRSPSPQSLRPPAAAMPLLDIFPEPTEMALSALCVMMVGYGYVLMRAR